MRSSTLLSTALLAFSPLLPTASAYTAGWQPGQAYTKYLTSTSSAGSALPTGANGQPIVIKESEPWKWSDLKDLANNKFGLEHILTHGPVSRVIEKFGFNVTAQLEMAREGVPPRFRNDIPLITDENYETFLLDEQYDSFEEEEERVWAIMCSIGMQDPVSTYFDKTFDGAYNLTVEAGDLKHVKWARIDYLAVTEITTRWGIWKAPVLVISKDRGRELRFFKVGALKEMREPEELRAFLLNNEWENTAPWSGPWSPRGSRAHILEKYSKFSAIVYSWLAIMPRWLLLLITGTVASTVINFLHSGEEEKLAKAKAEKLKASGGKEVEDTPEWAKEQEAAAAKEAAAAAKEAGAGSAAGVKASKAPSTPSKKKTKGKK